jgi:hypothetical protein
METQQTTSHQDSFNENGHDDNGHHEDQHKVQVKVDSHEVAVRSGNYIVTQFKAAVGVEPAKELDQIIHGQLTPLDDAARIDIKGGEEFISHQRAGGSS